MRLRGDLTPGEAVAEGPLPDQAPVLVGGVGYRWSGDGSFGLAAADRLAELEWPAGVAVEDLGYGALYVAQDLAAARPAWRRLVLLAGVERGRPPGTLTRYRWSPSDLDPEELQERVREAGAGVIDLDHLLAIAQHFEALPPEVVVFELEPAAKQGEELSPLGRRRLDEATAAVRREVLAPEEAPR